VVRAVIRKLIFIALIILVVPCSIWSQSLSDKKVSINLDQVTIPEALDQISALDGIKLSYNPDIIPSDRTITRTLTDQSIEKVLTEVLGQGYEYKYRGSYIIIQKTAVKEVKKTNFTVAGEVRDAVTGEILKDVTVYEVNKFESTLTDDRGNFELSVSSKTDYITLAISRESYLDTLIQVKTAEDIGQQLVLRPKMKDAVAQTVSQTVKKIGVETSRLVQFFTTKESRENARNVIMEELDDFQVSIIPMLGTNGRMSGQVKNKYSFNLFAGYSRGLDGAEFGGMYNIERENVNGAQFAGFGNAVGGEVKGAQFAGFANTNKGYTVGMQAAGFVNLVTAQSKGAQMAGFTNITTGDVMGTQLSGFYNYARDFDGWQAAGFLNTAKSMDGAQMSGFVNISANEASGAQMAGFYNFAKDMKGIQMSSFLNMTGSMEGFQMSGFMNMARKLKGVQLGILNIADTVERGATIGIVNIVKNGKVEFGFEYNDFMDANLTFRSGTNRFYTVLTGGMEFSDVLWSYGFGFGTQFTWIDKFHSNLELTAHSIHTTDSDQTWDSLNLLNRLNLNFGYQFAKHLSLNAGPCLNVYITEAADPASPENSDSLLKYSAFHQETVEDVYLSMWVGYAMSIRF
jgi:hypothetical protein